MAATLGRLLTRGRRRKYRIQQPPKGGWVSVRTVRLARDDGILYPHDRLGDVADDKDQIIAEFDERGNTNGGTAYHPHGDGTSSAGTESPDVCRSPEIVPSADSKPNGTGGFLQVRRGSEPALNRLDPLESDPKRWSTAVVGAKGDITTSEDEEEEEERGEGSGEERHFQRSAARLSVLTPEHWEQAARCRREPLGGSDSPKSTPGEYQVLLKNESEPLGIRVVPEYDSSGRDNGLVIQGIESGGRIHRDGRLAVGDRIVAVNGHSLRGVDFPHAQRIFREALSQDQHVCLGMQRKYSEEEEEQNKSPPPPPVYPKPSNQLSSNTRKMGRKIILDLVKGPNGLGFSLTTRDNPAGTTLPPVYVKNVLPMGAAIEDGRLRAGDRLLEIDGCEVRSQTEAVAMLRSVPMGETVHITVSRQDSPPSLPRQLPSENEDPAEGAREVLTFKIPLNDTGSAGLGISLKGKSVQAPDGSYIDLGIFIKSIFHGGAAYKDGRLKTNDQLVNVNGTSLLSLSNSEAMDALRRTMTRGEGPILLSVARRVSPPFPDCEDGPLNETYHLNGGVHEDDTSSSECFSRDGLGRQSMSEKRHGQLDAKVTDTYKRAKENRVLKEESATPVPPPPSEQPPPSSTVEAPPPATAPPAPRRPPVVKSNSLESLVVPPATAKRKGGLFRGLGSMFRFGKGKKNSSSSNSSPKTTPQHVTSPKTLPRRTSSNHHQDSSESSRVVPSGSLSRPPQGWSVPPPSTESPHRNAITPCQPRRRTAAAQQSLRHRQNHSPATSKESQHLRSRSFDIYKEVEKAGSRAGIADPNFFQHVMSWGERPQSNFFEYESVAGNTAPPPSQHVRSYSQMYRPRPPPLSLPHAPMVVASSKV